MRAYHVDVIQHYISPDSPYWARVEVEKVPMMPTPLPMQPTDYIRRSWENRPYGQLPSIDVASVHDGENWAIRASWTGSAKTDEQPDINSDFPDAFAVGLPVRNNPVLFTMGAEDAPIHILRWATNKKGAESILATGIGSSRPGPEIPCTAEAAAEEQIWHLVITRPLGSGLDVAPLTAGAKTGVGFALWRGDNKERAGIKAFSVDWTELELEA